MAPKTTEQNDASDLDLAKLGGLAHVYATDKIFPLPTFPGFYTLTGGIMSGKTTLLKLWMQTVKVNKQARYSYFSLADMKDTAALVRVLKNSLDTSQSALLHYVFLDDASALSDWDKAINECLNNNLLQQVVLVVADVDYSITAKAKQLFATLYQYNIHLTSLSFHEVVLLKNPNKEIEQINLLEEFNQYLLHGGNLNAINDMAKSGKILDTTLKNYMHRLKKLILKHGRHENFLQEIFDAMIKHYDSPITWNELSHELSIEHPKTIQDYITLLATYDAVFIQSALGANQRDAAPKKARKLMFTDPFIFHAVRAWLNPVNDVFNTQISPIQNDLALSAKLVTACVITHFSRHFSTFYIKAQGMIDLAYLANNKVYPIVVHWNNHFQAKDLKQILKYPNGKILTKMQRSGVIEHIRTEPVPYALWKLGV
ncbi:MAG: ATP-binding protein [Gammaproteobacteria bacterium]|nr:ATP-binding protein [Gammaproteobacteria bacterium]